jgi:hypothetical protein
MPDKKIPELPPPLPPYEMHPRKSVFDLTELIWKSAFWIDFIVIAIILGLFLRILILSVL